MRRKLWLVVLGSLCLAANAASVPADPGDLCVDLRRVLAAAEERRPFASTAQPGVPLALMGFSTCGAGMLGPVLVCINDYPDSLGRWHQLHRGIRACLPNARLVRQAGLSPPRADEHRVQFLVGRTLFTVEEAGYANIPERYVAIHVEPISRRQARRWAAGAATGK